MRWLKQFALAVRARVRGGSRISLAAYVKGADAIRLGRKCKVHANSSIDATRGAGVVFGDQVTLNRFAYVQGGIGGVRLGDHVEINNYTIINGTGGVDIGQDTLVGPGAKLISYQHGFRKGATIRSQPVEARPIRVGRDCWIGANAVVMAGVSIGDGAVVGAGAVVTRDVPPNTVVAGVPAVVIKQR